MNTYVYRHIRLDKNEPFYIGIGSGEYFSRAYEKNKRNKIWKSITSRTKYEVEILFENLSREEACKKEIEFISIYGRLDKKSGSLANMTDGGDGSLGKPNKHRLGMKSSNETKQKMSEARKLYYKNGGIKNAPVNYSNNFRGKLIIDLQTGIFYDNIKSAANSICIKPSTLRCRISKEKEKRFVFA
jgi:hypothetical protein